MTSHEVATALGWVGATTMLLGYFLVSTGKVSGDGLTFQVLNLVGAFGLLVVAAAAQVWPSVMLNIIWGAIGLVALRKALRHREAAPGPGAGAVPGSAGAVPSPTGRA